MPLLLTALITLLPSAPPVFAETGEPFLTTAEVVVTERSTARSSVVTVLPEGAEVRVTPAPGERVAVTVVGTHDELIEGYVLASLLRPKPITCSPLVSAGASEGRSAAAAAGAAQPSTTRDAERDPHDLGPLIAYVATLDAQRATARKR